MWRVNQRKASWDRAVEALGEVGRVQILLHVVSRAAYQLEGSTFRQKMQTSAKINLVQKVLVEELAQRI